MAEPEVEAAWRAEFKQVGEAQFRDSLNRGLSEAKRFRWWGDEGEARRLRDEKTTTMFAGLSSLL